MEIKLLSLVVPAYKQENTIIRDIKNIENALSSLPYQYEIIVVVDGFLDKTFQKAVMLKSSKIKILGYEKNQGKGYAVKYGMHRARGDIIGFIDSGMDINPKGLSMLIEHFKWYGADIIVGSKRHPVSKISYPFVRKLISFTSQVFIRLLFGLRIRDTQVGIKVFKRKVIKKVLPKLLIKKYAFDIELLVVSNHLGFKRIFEAPIEIKWSQGKGITNRNLWKILLLTFIDVLAIFYRLKILNYYKDKKEIKNKKKKILILNWRDIKNPSGGGAEILTHEIAKRWVEMGHEVIQISSIFTNAKEKETIDGVRIFRMGHPDIRFFFSSVHFKAFLYYMNNLRNEIDLVVDEIHGMPFFTPLFVRKKKIVLICEVAGNLWYETFGKVFGILGRSVEIFCLRFLYKNMHFITISNSTKQQLISEGINKEKIHVIPMGISVPDKLKEINKEKHPTIIFVGRLAKTKGVEDAIMAINKIKEKILNISFWIVGRGDEKYVRTLKKLVRKYKLGSNITFLGFVEEKNKFELMSKAHILVAPSVKEGWGLIVPEAGFVGTPSIVYDVPGLRDIVINGKNGIKISNNPDLIAKEAINLFRNKKFYKKIQKGAIQSSRKYTWDDSAKIAFSIINKL